MKADDFRVGACLPWTMASELKPAIRNDAPLNGAREAALKFAALGTGEQFAIWEKIWQEVFGANFHDSGMIIPERAQGFDWPIAVPNLTPSRLIAAVRLKSLFKIDLSNISSDTVVSFWDGWKPKPRRAVAPYLIWIRSRLEPDYELEKRSAFDLTRLRLNSITLEARIMLEVLLHELTAGKRVLDQKCWTLCAASHDKKGLTPCVYWNSTLHALQISGWFPTERSALVVAREAVA